MVVTAVMVMVMVGLARILKVVVILVLCRKGAEPTWPISKMRKMMPHTAVRRTSFCPWFTIERVLVSSSSLISFLMLLVPLRSPLHQLMHSKCITSNCMIDYGRGKWRGA